MTPTVRLVCGVACRTVLAVGALCAGVGSAEGQCLANTGALGAPPELWGRLRPVAADRVQVPAARDTTEYTGSQTTTHIHPLFTSVDVEGDIAYTSYSYGLHVWSLAGASADDPRLLAFRDQLQSGHFLVSAGQNENRWLFWDVDVPDGDDTVVALAGHKPFGITIFDVREPSRPTIKYQERSKHAEQLWSVSTPSGSFAFLAVKTGDGPLGVHAFDLTAARDRAVPCTEPLAVSSSCGVYAGQLPGMSQATQFVDGMRRADGRVFLAASSGSSPKGVRLWDVTNPRSPVDILDKRPDGSSIPLLADRMAFGIALWQSGSNGRSYLAHHALAGGEIWDVTDCLDGLGCQAPTLVWSKSWTVNAKRFVTHSSDEGQDFLYFGQGESCGDGLQREHFFDVTDVAGAGPDDLTPTPTMLVGGQLVDYWGWYMAGSPTGFNNVTPMVARVAGARLYRAAYTLFDVHEVGSPKPTAAFSFAPASGILPGAVVDFSDESSPQPDDPIVTWSWAFPGGVPVASTERTPSVTWTLPGTYEVSLTVCASECATKTGAVTVDYPPIIVDFAWAPTLPEAGRPASFENRGGGAESWAWIFPGATPAQSEAETPGPVAWSVPGVYQVSLIGCNAVECQSLDQQVTVVLPEDIFGDGFEAGTAGAWD